MARVRALTDPGLLRRENQDRIVVNGFVLGSGIDSTVVLDHHGPLLAAVIDGMGGHPGGDIAAAIVADVLASGWERVETRSSLVALVEAANAALYDTMERIPALASMGATLAGVAVVGGELLLFNVGDARVYLRAGTYLIQATEDDRRPSAAGGAVTQSLGGLPAYVPVQVHIAAEELVTGQVLICSDGLHGPVAHEALVQAFDGPCSELLVRLRTATFAAGAPDNVSIVVVEIVGSDVDTAGEQFGPGVGGDTRP